MVTIMDDEETVETVEPTLDIDADTVDAPDTVLGDNETVNEGDIAVDAPDVTVSDGDVNVTVVTATDDAPAESDAIALDHEARIIALEIAVGELTSHEARITALEGGFAELVVAPEESDGGDDDADVDYDAGVEAPEPRSAGAHPMFRSFSDWRRK